MYINFHVFIFLLLKTITAYRSKHRVVTTSSFQNSITTQKRNLFTWCHPQTVFTYVFIWWSISWKNSGRGLKLRPIRTFLDNLSEISYSQMTLIVLALYVSFNIDLLDFCSAYPAVKLTWSECQIHPTWLIYVEIWLITMHFLLSFLLSFSWGRSELTDRNVELYPQFFLELITTQLRFYMASPQLSLLTMHFVHIIQCIFVMRFLRIGLHSANF